MHNHESAATKLEEPGTGAQIQSNVIAHLRTSPAFAELVRLSLRNDPRPWVRGFSAAMLLKALKAEAAGDAIFALSDPDYNVRAFAILGILAAKIEGTSGSFAAGLLSKESDERLATINGINQLLGWKGLPYYSAMIYDRDPNVASEAAIAFNSCKPEDAAPHLIRYLREKGRARSSRRVTTTVIQTLYKLHHEPIPEKLQLKQEVNRWIQRLEKDSPT